MVASNDLVANVVFLIESTAITGAYMSEMRNNYIVPTLEYFSLQGLADEHDLFPVENSKFVYGVITYKTVQSLPGVTCSTYGPFSNPQKVLNAIDKLDLTGGKSESNANLAEGLATALVCFEDMNEIREEHGGRVQNHCILLCNSTPYSMPVMECIQYENKTIEQMAALFQEKSINLSIISPRKIPILIKIFEKADGDMSSMLNKDFSKDPRHLVLLKGYSFNDRPTTPQTNANHPNSLNASMQSPRQNNPNAQKDGIAASNQTNMIRSNSGGNLFDSSMPLLIGSLPQQMAQRSNQSTTAQQNQQAQAQAAQQQKQNQQQQQQTPQQQQNPQTQAQPNQQQQNQPQNPNTPSQQPQQQQQPPPNLPQLSQQIQQQQNAQQQAQQQGLQMQNQQATTNAQNMQPSQPMPNSSQPQVSAVFSTAQNTKPNMTNPMASQMTRFTVPQQMQQQQRPLMPNANMNLPNIGAPQGNPNMNANSALISQLSTPINNNQHGPNIPLQQQQAIRMQLLNQQQQQIQQEKMQEQQKQLQDTQPDLRGMQNAQPHLRVTQNAQPHLNQMQQQQQQMQRPGMPNPPNANAPMQPMMPQQLPSQSQPGQANAPLVNSTMTPPREKIWSGILEWVEKAKSAEQAKVPHAVPCYVTAKEGDPEIQGDNWPPRLLMQLMPKQLVGNIGQQFLKDSKSVAFHPSPCESLENLTKVMSSGFAGCVHFNNQNAGACDIRVLILFYSVDKKAYLGFIPNNQTGFVERLRKVISQKQGMGRQGQPPNVQPNLSQDVTSTTNTQINMPSQQNLQQNAQMQQQQINQVQQQMMQQQQAQQQNQMKVNPMEGPNMSQQHQEQMIKMENFNQMSTPMINQGGNQIPVPVQQMQDTMQQHMPIQADFNKMAMIQQQQRLMGIKMNPQMMNVQRMMRPGMPNPNVNPAMMNPNSNLRHLLQPQNQPQQGMGMRPMMGMQGQNNMMNPNMNMNMNIRQQNPNQQFNDPNFDYMQ